MSALRRFKPYPAYKDSGVEWLGEIPAHWEASRLRIVSKPTGAERSPGSSRRDRGVVRPRWKRSVSTRASALETTQAARGREGRYRYFRAGDIVIAKISPVRDGRSSRAGLANRHRVFGTTELHVLRAPTPQIVASCSTSRSATHSDDRVRRICTALAVKNGYRSPSSGYFSPRSICARAARHRRVPRPGDGADRCAGGEEGAPDRAAPGEAHRPHHPRRHQGPRPDRPHEGLRRRVAGGDSGALGDGSPQARCLPHADCPHETPTYDDDGTMLSYAQRTSPRVSLI